jgi:hypothetical protein
MNQMIPYYSLDAWPKSSMISAMIQKESTRSKKYWTMHGIQAIACGFTLSGAWVISLGNLNATEKLSRES